MRPIDADKLREKLVIDYEARETYFGEMVLKEIAEAPTVETERPKGEWIWRSTSQWCSECNALKPRKYPYSNYCPNCGADMRGGTE